MKNSSKMQATRIMQLNNDQLKHVTVNQNQTADYKGSENEFIKVKETRLG